jgi:multiple sugar transport system permease protein
VAIFHFLYTWNDFMGPLIYLDNVAEAPLVLGLYTFRGRFGGSVEWNLMMAATLAVTAPVIALFFVAQRHFIEGVTLTGLKGA